MFTDSPHKSDAAVKIGDVMRLLTPDYLKEHAAAKSYPQALAMLKQYQRTFQECSIKLGFSPLDRSRLDVRPTADPDVEKYLDS